MTNGAEPEVPRRLLQDFVTVPVPLDVVQARAMAQPSPVPHWIEGAMWSPPIPDLWRKAGRHQRVRLTGVRDRVDGCSTQVEWSSGLRGFPAFDGELVFHRAEAHATWLGLEGAISMASASLWSERELRDAQIQLRRLLMNLCRVLVHDVRSADRAHEAKEM